MDRFKLVIAVGLLGVLLAGCGDEYVCPTGTVSERGRCRIVGPDGVDADVFVWPPGDTTTDLGAPVPFRPDAAAVADGAPGDAVTGDALTDDAATDDATTPGDTAPTGDGATPDGGAADAGATDSQPGPPPTDDAAAGDTAAVGTTGAGARGADPGAVA